MKCTICGKELVDDELENINEICFDCQRVLEWIYEEQNHEDKAERLESLLKYLKEQEGKNDSNSV